MAYKIESSERVRAWLLDPGKRLSDDELYQRSLTIGKLSPSCHTSCHSCHHRAPDLSHVCELPSPLKLPMMMMMNVKIFYSHNSKTHNYNHLFFCNTLSMSLWCVLTFSSSIYTVSTLLYNVLWGNYRLLDVFGTCIVFGSSDAYFFSAFRDPNAAMLTFNRICCSSQIKLVP